jgi:hypothetical protein
VKHEGKKKGYIKRKKEYCERVEWIRDCITRKESRKFYKQVNRMRRGFQGRSLSCRNMEGEILRNNIDVLIFLRFIWGEGG